MGSEITTCCFLLRPASLFLFINMCYIFSLRQNNTHKTDGCLRQQNITSPCNLISCCSAFYWTRLKWDKETTLSHFITFKVCSFSPLSILGKKLFFPIPLFPNAMAYWLPWGQILLRQRLDGNSIATEWGLEQISHWSVEIASSFYLCR